MSNGEKMSLSFEELSEWGRQNGLPSSEESQYGILFLGQLWKGFMQRSLDLASVVREIRILESGEDASSTKPATQFRRSPLHPFWHKHYFQAEFVPQNLAAEAGASAGGSGRLNEKIEELFEKYMGQEVSDGFANELAHEMTVGAFSRRSNRSALTGEWIIFGVQGANRYFLSLGFHEEDDQEVYDRIRKFNEHQFPFLFESSDA